MRMIQKSRYGAIMVFMAFGFWANAQYSGTGNFVALSSLDQLEDGHYVIASTKTGGSAFVAMDSTHSGTLFPSVDIFPTGGVLENPPAAIVWSVVTDGGGRTIFSEATSKYASYSGSANNIQVTDGVTAENQRWSFSFTTSNLFRVENRGVPGRFIQYNRSSPRFVCYTGTQVDLTLFKLESSEGVLSVSFNKADGFTVIEGTSDSITATASNGLEPYGYVWGSTLDGTHYTALENVFTILDTAPSGSYSATVTVTDDDSISTNRTINFEVVTAYAININAGAGGTVTTAPAGFATEGTTVTITANPDAGYDLGLISVVGADSTPVDLTGNTFTMPGQAVTVSVTFEEISAPPGVLAWFLASSANSNAPVQPPAFLETGLSLADDGITGTGAANVLLKTPTTAWIDEYHYAHVAGTGAYVGERGEKGFVLTIDALEGTTFSLSSISFRHRATATGPGQVGVKVNGVEFAGTGNTASAVVGTYQSEDLGLAELTQAIIYIQGWASGGSGSGEFQINDIQIAGVVDGEGPGPVEPTAQDITSFSVNGGVASVSIGASQTGVNYVLTYSDTIGNTNPWNFVDGPFVGTGAAVGPFNDNNATNAARFYRIEATAAQ